MRIAAFIAGAIVILGATCLMRPAAAQGAGDVYAFGLAHTALGGGTPEYDPVARRLTYCCLGSSGEDGVEVNLKSSMKGCVLQFDPVSLPPAGSSRTCALQGTPVGSPAPTTLASLTENRNVDGSVDVAASFPGMGVTHGWVALMNCGTEVKRLYRSLPIELHCTPVSPAPSVPEHSVSMRELSATRGIAVDIRLLSVINVSSPGLPAPIPCDAIRIMCDGGGEIASLSSVRVTGTDPSGTGAITLVEEGIVPPCAGCPNGPDWNGDSFALGDAQFLEDPIGAAALVVANIGSSGQDGVSIEGRGDWYLIRGDCTCREGPLGCTTKVGAVLDEMPLAPGTLTCTAHGAVSGADHPLGQLTCTITADGSEFDADFSAAGATGYRVLLYSGGTQVADVSNPLGRASHQKPQTQWLVQSDIAPNTGAAEFRIICITSPCPGWTVTLQGAVYVVDQIVFQPIDPMPGSAITTPDYLTSLDLRASSSPSPGNQTMTGASLPIYEVRVTSGAPSVGVDDVAHGVDLAPARLMPNPTAGPARLVFAMPRAGRARVSVVDVAGRQVRELADANFGAGAHDLTWDGRDDGGHPSAAGMYFVRIESGSSTRVARVTRLQ